MKKKIFLGFFIVTLLILCYFLFVFIEYIYTQKTNKNMITYCSENYTDECYRRMFELMVPELLINNVKIKNDNIELINLDSQTRIDIENIIKKSDALLGYGIYFTSEYEDNYAETYNKIAYAFDCGVQNYSPKSSKCLFFSECIASDDFLIFDHMFTKKMQVSSGRVHTLEQKLKELNLQNKKVYIKMDIVNADVLGIQELIKNSDNVLGFNLAIYIQSPKEIIERVPLLKELNKKFVLVSRTVPYRPSNSSYRIIDSKYTKNIQDGAFIYLSYVNKKIIDSYRVSFIQNSEKYYKNKKIKGMDNIDEIPLFDISWVVVVSEMFQSVVERSKNEN